MATLNDDDIRHIAKLARLHIAESDVPKYATQLSAILGFVEQLQEVDTSSVEATAQVTGLRNVFRDDRLQIPKEEDDSETLLRPASRPSPDALLACSPLPITEHQIQTPSAHES